MPGIFVAKGGEAAGRGSPASLHLSSCPILGTGSRARLLPAWLPALLGVCHAGSRTVLSSGRRPLDKRVCCQDRGLSQDERGCP